MPTVDMSTRIGVRAMLTAQGVAKRLKTMVPLGPGKERVSPAKALARINAMSPQERMMMAERIGPDVFNENVRNLERQVLGV